MAASSDNTLVPAAIVNYDRYEYTVRLFVSFVDILIEVFGGRIPCYILSKQRKIGTCTAAKTHYA